MTANIADTQNDPKLWVPEPARYQERPLSGLVRRTLVKTWMGRKHIKLQAEIQHPHVHGDLRSALKWQATSWIDVDQYTWKLLQVIHQHDPNHEVHNALPLGEAIVRYSGELELMPDYTGREAWTLIRFQAKSPDRIVLLKEFSYSVEADGGTQEPRRAWLITPH